MTDAEYTREWEDYFAKKRAAAAGLLKGQPQPPFQRGHHIDVLPFEINPPANPHQQLAVTMRWHFRRGTWFRREA